MKIVKLCYKEDKYNTNSKLKCVKAVRDITGWGLYDCKRYVDHLYTIPGIYQKLPINSNNTLTDILQGFPVEIEYEVIDYTRNLNLLSLGLGEMTEYQGVIQEYLFESQDPKVLQEKIDFILELLTPEQLYQIIQKINHEHINQEFNG